MATEKSNKANDAAQDKANSERQKALDTALAQIERQFGKGSVMKMSERQNTVIEVIPTGSTLAQYARGDTPGPCQWPLIPFEQMFG